MRFMQKGLQFNIAINIIRLIRNDIINDIETE